MQYQGRLEEPRVPQDLKKNDIVYLIALLDHVLWTKKKARSGRRRPKKNE